MAAGADALDRGSLKTIFESNKASDKDSDKAPDTVPDIQPILQCLQVKPLAGQAGGQERFRAVFSDGENFVQSMLASQANYVVYEKKLRKGCFVRLKSFQGNHVKGRRVIIVLDLEVLDELGECEKVGNPQGLGGAEEDTKQEAKPTTVSTGGFYGNKVETKPAPAPRPPTNPAFANVRPIESLNPYLNKWAIKARVTVKTDIKEWHNKNGSGKLFSVNFMDESGEIRATGFKDQVDMFYDLLQKDSVYYITGCRVGNAKKQFSNLPHDYELTFENNTVIEKADDPSDVPQVRFNFTNLADVANIEKDAVLDTIGILTRVDPVEKITSRATSKEYEKRKLTLVDNTMYEIEVTVWGNVAKTFDVPESSVVAFKGVKVSDFGGRSLSLLSSGTISVSPDIDEAYKLKGWYNAQGSSASFSNHKNMAGGIGSGRSDDRKTILQVKDEGLGMSEEKPDYFTIKATTLITRRESTFYYPACASESCNRKVVQTGDGGWMCEHCSITHPRPQYRYVMSMNCIDHTGNLWLSFFDEAGRQVMGMSADELQALEENDKDKFNDAVKAALHQTFIIRCRAKMENYNNTQRPRYAASGVKVVDPVGEAAKMVELIKLYE